MRSEPDLDELDAVLSKAVEAPRCDSTRIVTMPNRMYSDVQCTLAPHLDGEHEARLPWARKGSLYEVIRWSDRRA